MGGLRFIIEGLPQLQLACGFHNLEKPGIRAPERVGKNIADVGVGCSNRVPYVGPDNCTFLHRPYVVGPQVKGWGNIGWARENIECVAVKRRNSRSVVSEAIW